MVAISAGCAHSAVIRGDGTVWTWGSNERNQLGRETTWSTQRYPGQVPGIYNATAVSAALEHTVIIRDEGTSNPTTVWTWGSNNAGALGNNETNRSLHPVRVHGVHERYLFLNVFNPEFPTTATEEPITGLGTTASLLIVLLTPVVFLIICAVLFVVIEKQPLKMGPVTINPPNPRPRKAGKKRGTTKTK